MNHLHYVDYLALKTIKQHYKHQIHVPLNPASPITLERHCKRPSLTQLSPSLLISNYDAEHIKTNTINHIIETIGLDKFVTEINENFNDFMKSYRTLVNRELTDSIVEALYDKMCFYIGNGHFQLIKFGIMNETLTLHSLTLNIIEDLEFFHNELPSIICERERCHHHMLIERKH